MSFVHLHNHTMHSVLDGLQKIDEMVAAAAADGQPAIAISDHGSLAGTWEMAMSCRSAGIKPILGIEAYLALSDDPGAERNRFDPKTIEVPADDDFDGSNATDDGPTKRKSYEHLTMLAATPAGWRNLVAMSNEAERSFRSKPLFDYALMRLHSEGIIVGTGCLGGPVAGNLLRGDADAAERELLSLVDIFGSQNVFVEVMYHGIPAEDAVIPGLVELAKRHDLLVVATNDCHYTHADQHEVHDAWLCMSQKRGGKPTLVSDENRFRFNGEGYHLRTAEEMHAIFDRIPGCEDAVSNSLLIAARIDDDVIGRGHIRLPHFDVTNMGWRPVSQMSVTPGATVMPDGTWSFPDPQTAMMTIVRDGAISRYGQPFTPELKARLRREFDVINNKGFAEYFLIKWDVVEWARSDRGMPTPAHPRGESGQKKPILVGAGRGSAPGSAVAYCMGITGIDPLEHDLLFERFLDPSRLDMPDIDTDFEPGRRDEVIQYLEHRWGSDRVALLGTWQVNWAKSSVKDMGRVTDRSELANQLTAVMAMGADAKSYPLPLMLTRPEDLPEDANSTTRGIVQANQALRDLVEANPEAQDLVTDAMAVEGVKSNESVHACGVVIGDEPLEPLIPLRWGRKLDNGHWVTQWDPDSCGENGFGLIKFDILSLDTLDIVSRTLEFITEAGMEAPDIDHLPETGEQADRAWAMLAEGRTAGVFQLSSSGMTELCRNMGPTSLSDLSALVALYRPGPMAADMHNSYARRKRGTEQVSYTNYTSDPDETRVLKSVLGKYQGIIAMQENLMQLAREVADFSDKEVNLLRKAFSKKKRDVMDSLKTRWDEGGKADHRRTWLDHGADFVKDADGNPVPAGEKVAFSQGTLNVLWHTFEGSASYLFNASHSMAYGYDAWITAFLKANWPSHFAAAMLACVPRDATDKRRAILADLASEGIEVLPPDVNLGSVVTAADEGGSVRIGLAEVRDVGSVAEWVVAERERGGPFTSLADLCERVRLPAQSDSLALTKKMPASAVEALIESGALDSFGPRLGMMVVARAPEVSPPDMEWGALERSARQRTRLNIGIGESPLAALQDQVRTWREPGRGAPPVPISKVPANSGSNVVTLGVVAQASSRRIRTGEMISLVVEGSDGASMEAMVWPKAARSIDHRPEVGEIVAISGRTRVSVVPGTDEEDESSVTSISAFNVWVGNLSDPLRVPDEFSGLFPAQVAESIPAGDPEPDVVPDPIDESSVVELVLVQGVAPFKFLTNRPGPGGEVQSKNQNLCNRVFPGFVAWYSKNRHNLGARESFPCPHSDVVLEVSIAEGTGDDGTRVKRFWAACARLDRPERR